MDLLFKRYASPFLLVDQMILAAQFSDFVQHLHDANENDRLWDFFLHKVYDKSFEEFKGSLGTEQPKVSEMSDAQIETTVKNSFDILQGFIPE